MPEDEKVETITVPEAMAILGKSDKSIRNYIKRHRLSAEEGPDRKLRIPKHEVLQLAKHPAAQIPTDKLEKLTNLVEELTRKVGVVESRLSEVEKMLEAFTNLITVETPTYSPQPRRKRTERQQTDTAASIAGNVPEGYVVYPHFLHGVPDSTAKRYINNEEEGFTITEGSWKYGNHIVTKLLSPSQQHEYYLALHNHPRFKTCPDCPHSLDDEET